MGLCGTKLKNTTKTTKTVTEPEKSSDCKETVPAEATEPIQQENVCADALVPVDELKTSGNEAVVIDEKSNENCDDVDTTTTRDSPDGALQNELQQQSPEPDVSEIDNIDSEDPGADKGATKAKEERKKQPDAVCCSC